MVEVFGVIMVKGDVIFVVFEFLIVVVDYDIEILVVVRDNIVKEVKVMVVIDYQLLFC